MNKDDNQQSQIAAVPTPPFRTWRDPQGNPVEQHRLDGMRDFERRVTAPGNEGERARCILDPCYAKRKFAEWGGFYLEGEGPFPGFEPIPATTVIRVYDSNTQREKRDEQVVLVLDVVGDEEGQTFEDMYTWRCTYTPYLQRADAGPHEGRPTKSPS